MNTLVLPGLIDAHVHLRTPGATHKEDVRSGTEAALAGGFTIVLDMPNTRPPTTDSGRLAAKGSCFQGLAACDYGFLLGYTGGDLDATLAAADGAVGLKLYLDETYGGYTLSHACLDAVFESWTGPGPIAIHGEVPAVRLALDLAAVHDTRVHVCHVPDPGLLLEIDEARNRGVEVTCEVTPHHLFLSTADEERLGAFARMKPPLVAPPLVDLFWERLDSVDIIATDHAPHTGYEKSCGRPPPGVPGLETALPLLLRAVDRGRLTLERLIDLLNRGPRRVYGLPVQGDTEVVVEVSDVYRLPFGGYRTRCGWSPFAGMEALGRVKVVRLRGATVYADGRPTPLAAGRRVCAANGTGGE